MLLYVAFFLFLYLWTKRYRSWLTNSITLFYLAGAVCAVYVYHQITANFYSIESVAFHLLIIYLFMYPLLVFGRREKTKHIAQVDRRTFRLIAIGFMALGLFAVAYFIPLDIRILTSGDLGALRDAQTFGGEVYHGGGVLRTIAGVSSYYYCICLLLYFYSITFLNESSKFNWLLLIASTSRIFQAISYVGRDGILFWIFSFIFSFCLFRPYMEEKVRKQISKTVALILGFAVAVFSAITISRFRADGVLEAVVDYFGQGFNNFGRLFEYVEDYRGGKVIWPWLYGEKGMTGNEAMIQAVEFEMQYGFKSNVFTTFVGSFYRAYNPYLLAAFSLMYAFFVSLPMRKKRLTLSTMVLLMFAYQMVIHNYFYFVFANRVGNLYMLTIPLIMLLFSRLNKKSVQR